MEFLSNAHTHTSFCDGRDTPEEMWLAAKALGFVSLGFSGHGGQGFDEAYSMMGGRQDGYLAAINALKARHAQSGEGPRPWAGIELDALADEPWKRDARERFDYTIGSVHYLARDHHGAPASVDGDPTELRRYVDDVLSGDGLELARRYYAEVTRMALTDKPDIIGHFDLVRKHAARLKLFDETDPAYRRIALNALEEAFASGAILEVNTGGMARGYLATPYPTFELLAAWREMGGSVTLTSDCHDARLLDYGFKEAADLIAKAGFREIRQLSANDALWETIHLKEG